MTRLSIRDEDGIMYEPRIESLSEEEVYDYIQCGLMTFEQFKEYLEIQKLQVNED